MPIYDIPPYKFLVLSDKRINAMSTIEASRFLQTILRRPTLVIRQLVSSNHNRVSGGIFPIWGFYLIHGIVWFAPAGTLGLTKNHCF